jgi:predicted RNA-binding Zn-ribbon protein involved in translation (DUF1610 family)
MSGVIEAIGQAFGELLGHPAVGIATRFLALYVVIVWIASAWWVWRDARARSSDVLLPYLAAGGVLLVTPLMFPLAVVVYRLLRPPLTLSAATAVELQLAMLEEEATRSECGSCGAPVEDEWVACPACGAELATRCVSCGRPLELDWTICAWCAAAVPWAVETPSSDPRPARREPVAIPIRPGGRPLLPVMAAPDERPEPLAVPRARRRGTSRRSGS